MANNSSYLNTIICLGSLHKNAVQHWIQGPFFKKFISGYCHNDSSVNIKLRLKNKWAEPNTLTLLILLSSKYCETVMLWFSFLCWETILCAFQCFCDNNFCRFVNLCNFYLFPVGGVVPLFRSEASCAAVYCQTLDAILFLSFWRPLPAWSSAYSFSIQNGDYWKHALLLLFS